MRTLAVLPIKSFGAAKSRLSALLPGGSRQALAQAMFCDTLAALRRVDGLEEIAVVTSDSEAAAAAAAPRVKLLRDDAEAGHNEAAAIGVAHAVEAGFERVLLAPGDAPLLDPGDVESLLARSAAAGTQLAIVPDRHASGTNALLIAPAGAFAPSFGPGSLERHLELARGAGLRHAVEPVASLALDVDTPDDLAELSLELDARRGAAQLTRGVLRQLDRSRVRASASATAAA